MNNPDVYDISNLDDWYRLGYKTAYDLVKEHGASNLRQMTASEMRPYPFKANNNKEEVDMWEAGWIDGWGDADTHRSESCICYPGWCPQGCEPACPVC